MMESGFNVKSMEEALIFLPMEICMWVNIAKENRMDKERTPGLREVSTMDNLRMDSNMVKGFGGRIRMTLQVTNIRGCTNMIRNMDMENLLGSQEIFIREIIMLMNEMVTVKCILQMVLFTKGIGLGAFKQVKQP